MINDLIAALAVLALASTAAAAILKEHIVTDNYLHEIEREEARCAAMFDYGPCYRHDYRRYPHAGIICRDCGDEIGEDEL